MRAARTQSARWWRTRQSDESTCRESSGVKKVCMPRLDPPTPRARAHPSIRLGERALFAHGRCVRTYVQHASELTLSPALDVDALVQRQPHQVQRLLDAHVRRRHGTARPEAEKHRRRRGPLRGKRASRS